MRRKIKITLLIEFLYTFPIWIILIPYHLFYTIFAVIRHHKKNGVEGDITELQHRTAMRIISYKDKRFVNIFLSTMVWICIYKIFLK
jgi:hypothetical protein